MQTWLVSYADSGFRNAQRLLVRSAHKHGIDVCHPWSRTDLENSALYPVHRDVLSLSRGSGYWLWKPFIIKETLRLMAPGDILVYSDSGIEIVASPAPLFELCRNNGLLLFAGHYDDVGRPGPNICGKWTKRDCFVYTDCDETRYHDGQMVDASFILLTKTGATVSLIREWLLYCCQRQLLTDDPNVCGLPNLPAFIEHRHDQSILSLIAIREGIELYRHPSQHGNHVKAEPYREPGEWTRHPYGSKGIFHNSPYGTLLDHHRGARGKPDQ